MPTHHIVRVPVGFNDEIGPLSLRVGVHNRVILSRPRLVEFASAIGFGKGSAFPGPGHAAALKGVQEAVDGTAAQAIFFGHCDDSGSDEANKTLSERRARAMRALLTSDVAQMQTIAQDDGWDVPEFQAMLRALGYVAGAIDGEIGPMTQAAVEAFGFEHGQGEHPTSAAPTEGPELDAATRDSIIEAYTTEYGLEMPQDSFFGPAAVGCASFNSPGSDPSWARRVALTILQEAKTRPPSGEFPCTSDDVSACQLDESESPRCRFYRTFVVANPAPSELVFFDFRWSRTPTGKIHLSALCNAPDTDAVIFRVGMAIHGLCLPPASSSDGGTKPEIDVFAELTGYVRRGIVYALWDPGDFDPFELGQWFAYRNNPSAEEVEGFPVPTFEIALGEHWAYATPPGRPLHRIVLEREQPELIALLSDGSFARVGSSGSRLEEAFDPDRHAVAVFSPGARLRGVER